MPEQPTDSTDPADRTEFDVAEWLTDMLYTGVGLGVLAVNRIQVARRHVQADMADRNPAQGFDGLGSLLPEPDKARAFLAKLRDELQEVDDRLGGVEKQFTGALERLEDDLPDGARQLSAAIRSVTDDHATQLRAVLGLSER